MKKIIALLLAMIMVLALAACAAKTEPAQSETTEGATAPATLPYEGVSLTLGLAPLKSADVDTAFWNEQLKAFTTLTGAKVEVTVNDWSELQTKYLTNFMSGSQYDVFYSYPGMLPDFIDAGFMEDLTPYYSTDEIADEYFWSNSTYSDGKTYGVAFAGGAAYRCYVYNLDILEECGVTDLPDTWEEFLEVCETIHTARPDLYTFIGPLAGNSNAVDHMILQFLTEAGGSLMNEDNSAMTLNTPEMKKAFEFELKLIENGYLSEDALGMSVENTQALFAEGKAAITVAMSPQNYFADVDFEWIASTELADVKPASFNATDILCVNAACKNKQAAVDLIKFMNSTDVREAFNAEIYQSAKLRASDKDPDVDPRVADVWAHPERAFTMPMAKLPSTWTDSLMSTQQQILSGTVSVDEGLENLQAAVEAGMNE